MITGCLQQKNGFYYAVLYLKVNGRRRCKWVPMRLPVEGTSARKAQKAFDEIRLQYEREEEERLEREAKAKELAENTHPDALLPFTEYMEKWLQSTRSSLATATYQSYSNMIKARIRPYFTPLGLQLREVTPQHIEDFYQSILADDCTTNTVIHYHAIIRKALQTAVKKDILLKNPADKVDRPKKNVFHGSFYSEEEMLTLFDAVSGDPLELCVKIAAYYGLRRSEVLGLRWSAIDMEHNLHQSQGHRSRGGWKVRSDGRGCPENQIQLPNTTSDSSSRNHPAGGEREAGDVPETLQKKLLPGLPRLHLR